MDTKLVQRNLARAIQYANTAADLEHRARVARDRQHAYVHGICADLLLTLPRADLIEVLQALSLAHKVGL